jgi:hypothetical protein
MQCNEFEQILEQELEGALPAAAELHLQNCAGCAALWDDFQAIRQAGSELGAEEPEPPAYLWNSLRAQLESEGLIREARENLIREARENLVPAARAGLTHEPLGETATARLSGWFSRGPRLILAGSYAAVLLVAAFLSRYDAAPRVGEFSVRQSPGAIAIPLSTAGLGSTLDGNVKQVMASLPTGNVALTESFEHNLGIVDDLIVVCEKSVREKPDDPLAREYLYGAYQQKAVLLATAMDRSTLEDR